MCGKKWLLLLLLNLSIYSQQYVPIVLVHGILSNDSDMAPTEQFIRKYLGNELYVKNVQLGEAKSLISVYHQAKHFKEIVQNDPLLSNGFNVIAHSQGGLVSRYYIQRYNNPPVFTYISWGTPHQGVFGIPSALDKKFKWLNSMENILHHIIYSRPFQNIVSFAGYWHDPLHYEQYLRRASLLPYLNNEIYHQHAALFKKNICSLQKMVLVATTKEYTVEPSISCHFGFYKQGSKTDIEELFESEIYKNDLLGLKILHESGRLHLHTATCNHEDFPKDEQNFIENTLTYLKNNYTEQTRD
jgi:palmitoyl-protein thioesterase